MENKKYFTEQSTIVIGTYANKELSVLQSELKSKGMDISLSDLLSLIDIYIRTVGLDKEYSEDYIKSDDKFMTIAAWFSAVIKFNTLADLEASYKDMYKNLLLEYNKKIEYSIPEELIENNVDLILTEIPTFLEEATSHIREEVIKDNKHIAKYSMVINDKDDKSSKKNIILSAFYHKDYSTLVMEVMSSAGSSINNNTITVIYDSFPKKEDLEKEAKN